MRLRTTEAPLAGPPVDPRGRHRRGPSVPPRQKVRGPYAPRVETPERVGMLPDVARSGLSVECSQSHNALTWDLGVTEGTRTPDLQGPNLGTVAVNGRSRNVSTGLHQGR